MFTPLFKPVRAKTKVYLYLNYPKVPLASPGIYVFVRGLRRAYNRNSESSGGSRGGARGTPPPLLLGQTEAQRAEKKILDAAPPPPLM